MVIQYYVLGTTLLFTFSILLWVLNGFVLPFFNGGESSDTVWKASDIQLRILTVANEEVVSNTVEKSQEVFDDIIVIAEEDISVPCEVEVVPDDFNCNAIRKGRALEWGRRNIESDHEYVLYIDEDTIVKKFNTIPDYDVVQLLETPVITSSFSTYFTEVYRIGYQFEQRGFGYFKYPLYAWGGAIAIRQSLEDQVSWDAASITEDTNFVWRAASVTDFSFTLNRQKFYNQSPTDMYNLFKQRRRWVSGTLNDLHLLPIRYKLLVLSRIFIWSFAPLVFLNGVLIYLYPGFITTNILFIGLTLSQILVLHLTTVIGILNNFDSNKVSIIALPFTSIFSILNSIGCIWGLVHRTKDFSVTDKYVFNSK